MIEAEAIIEIVPTPLVVLDSELRVHRANQAFFDMFLVSREETLGRRLNELGNGQWNQPKLLELIDSALTRSEPFNGFERDHEFPHIGRRILRLNGTPLPLPGFERSLLLLAIEDVTEGREIAGLRFHRLFETTMDGIVVIDGESRTVQDVNPHFLEVTGFAREDFIGKALADAGLKLGLAETDGAINLLRQSQVVRYEDLALRTRSGASIRVDAVGSSCYVGGQQVIQFSIRDVSTRNRTLKELRESEQRFRLFVDSVGDFAMFQMDPNGSIVTWNPGAEHLLGWTEQEAIGKPGTIVFTPEDRDRNEPEREIESARRTGRAADERWHMRKDGSRFFASGVLTRVTDEDHRLVGFAKVMRDITLRKQHEEQLRQSVAEKDTLVREIHHRVKNNLQVIVSLLSMQSRYTTDARVLTAFQEAESRLRAIAHIHERLYASENLSEIEFGGYVTGLANELVQLHSHNPHQIELEIEVSDLAIHIERAIPLGLIANELILNSIKHGLNGSRGRLLVKLTMVPHPMGGDQLRHAAAPEWGELLIADSGPGLPEGVDPAKARSMGLRLVSMLVRQLRGHFESKPGSGAALSVSFPLQVSTHLPEGPADAAKGSDR